MGVADAASEAAAEVDGLATQMRLLNGILSESKALIDYERAVDDLRKSWSGGKGVNAEFEAGRKNIALLDEVAGTAAARFEDFTKKGKEAAAQRVATQAIADLRQFAADHPGARDYIRGLIRGLKDLNLSKVEIEARMERRAFNQAAQKVRDTVKGLNALLPTPRADLDDRLFRRRERGVNNAIDFLDRQVAKPLADLIDKATAAINGIRDNLNDLDGDSARVTIYRDTIYGNIYRRPEGGRIPVGATGGLVTGPGTSTSDSILARLSDGEFVVRTRAVEHYGADFFHRLNAMQFAGGGLASRAAVSVTAPQIDYTQLAAAMARAGLGVNIGSITSHDTRGVMEAFDRRLQTAITMLSVG